MTSTKTSYDAADNTGRVVNKTYTLECREGYTMLSEPDLTFSDQAVCKLDESVPSVKWVYNNTQDQPEECKGTII